MNILNSLKKKIRGNKRAEVYLGDIGVIPRNEFTKFAELNWEGRFSADEKLRAWIYEFVELPLLAKENMLSNDALRLDILVSNYTFGSTLVLFSDPPLPVAWRPKICVNFRLVNIRKEKVLGNFESKKYLGWRYFLSQVFTLRYIFGIKSAISSDDLKYLLASALVEGLEWAGRKT